MTKNKNTTLALFSNYTEGRCTDFTSFFTTLSVKQLDTAINIHLDGFWILFSVECFKALKGAIDCFFGVFHTVP